MSKNYHALNQKSVGEIGCHKLHVRKPPGITPLDWIK